MIHVCIVAENHASVRMAGAEYQTLLLTDELARRPDVRVTYVARRVPTGDATKAYPYELINCGNDAGIRRRAVFFDAPETTRILERIKPDVVYQQCLQSYTAVCARYAEKAGIPFFFHIAHDFDMSYRAAAVRLSPNTPFDLLEIAAGHWGLRHASHVIAQTPFQARLLRQNFARDPAAIIRNFQPLPDSLPEKQDSPMRVFWVANLKDWKRPGLFVDLAESFTGRDDIEFIMAGRPPTERRHAPLLARIPRVKNFTYLRELPIEKVNQIMLGAHMHVNTSTHEGFPNTFLQAWARGAVVATMNVDPDDGGMEKLGIGYCAKESLPRLHDFVDLMARDHAKRARLAQKAFEFVHANHSMRQGEHLADLIIDAAREFRARGAGTAAHAGVAGR